MKIFIKSSWLSFLLYLLVIFIVFSLLIYFMFSLSGGNSGVKQIPLRPENGDKNGSRGEVMLIPERVINFTLMIEFIY